jgi:hypothetical protein
VRKCGNCGGSRLRRVHRTLSERFSYLAIFECRDCENEEFVPRRYTYHLGENARCPKCGTFRVTKLRAPDKIDPMVSGLLNRFEKFSGGKLYHCCFCRIQFFDRRKRAALTTVEHLADQGGDQMAGEPLAAPMQPQDATTPQDRASSGE